jgi:hypothetical protein
MNSTRRLAYCVRLWLLLGVAVIGFASDSLGADVTERTSWNGVTELEASQTGLTIRIEPVVRRIDTVEEGAGTRVLRLSIAGAHPLQDENSTIVTWVVRHVYLLDHPCEPRIVRCDRRGGTQPFGLTVARDDVGRVLETEKPMEGIARAWYGGRAGLKHVVVVDVEVARSSNQITELAATVDVAVAFDAVSTPTVVAKQHDVAQNIERFDRVGFIPVTRSGLYRVSAEELRRLDLPIDAQAARNLKVFGRGGLMLPEQMGSEVSHTNLEEQPIIVRTNADGSVRDLLFYGQAHEGWRTTRRGIEHYVNPYDTRGGYVVTVGTTAGLRATAAPLPAATATSQPRSVTGRVFFEEDFVNLYNDGSGRRWLGRAIENAGSMTLTNQLHGFSRQGTVSYVVAGGHRTDATPGVLSLSEQGTKVVDVPLQGVPQYLDYYNDRRTGVLPAESLPADGRSVVRITYSSANRNATGALDYVEIHYPRQLFAHENEFTFWTDGTDSGVTEWMINGFSGEMFAFDITEPSRPILLSSISSTGGLYGLKVEMVQGVPRQFIITSATREARGERITWENLRSDVPESDVIVITHEDLLASANAYAAYRSSQGELTATVVSTRQIYREFGYGVQDPTALRDFIFHCFHRWSKKPRYILFWGDGHFDYRNISSQATSFVATYQSEEADGNTSGTATFVTDDFFVRVAGNDIYPDIAIGRLPVVSNEAGVKLIEKIRRYEAESALDAWSTRVVLVADDGETTVGKTDGSLHLDQSEGLHLRNIPPTMQASKLYAVEYPTENVPRGRRKPTVTQDLLSTINGKGAAIVNWIGHGNPRVWAHEQIFVRETTIPQMTNSDKPFLLTAATCDFARFDMTSIQSGAEELVLHENGGAIAVFSASRIVFATENDAINNEFYARLFQRDADGRLPRLGDALLGTKIRRSGNNDQKFLLLGDPTLRLSIPDQHIVFEEVNDIPIGDGGAHVQGLQTVRVKGRVIGRRTSDTSVDASFNGVATVSLFDADLAMAVRDNDASRTLNVFKRQGPNLSRTSAAVVDGRFEAEFVVPKDISFADLPGRMYGFAVSQDRRKAMGVMQPVFVNGIVDASFGDDIGPRIDLYLDSRRFQPGDFVRANPFLIVDLWDATGVNTTGVGVGHDIEANINNQSRIEVLTNSYETSLSDPKAGTARRQIFGLGSGTHHVRVRAWDVLNNFSEAETSFRIVGPEGTVASGDLLAFPNPFVDRTTITFKHTFDAPFELRLAIYTNDGRLVFSYTGDVLAMQTAEIEWNARDTNGDVLPSGPYHAVATCVSRSGAVTVVGGKLSLVR